MAATLDESTSSDLFVSTKLTIGVCESFCPREMGNGILVSYKAKHLSFCTGLRLPPDEMGEWLEKWTL